jgi:hypothetical protein
LYLTNHLIFQVLVAEVVNIIVPSCATNDVACLATGTHLAVFIIAVAKVQVIDILDCAAPAVISKLAQTSVVAELETVEILQLQVCVCITVVTIHTIDITSTKPVTVNIAQVVVAGKALLLVIATNSLSFWFVNLSLTPLVQAVHNSVSVGAVV